MKTFIRHTNFTSSALTDHMICIQETADIQSVFQILCIIHRRIQAKYASWKERTCSFFVFMGSHTSSKIIWRWINRQFENILGIWSLHLHWTCAITNFRGIPMKWIIQIIRNPDFFFPLIWMIFWKCNQKGIQNDVRTTRREIERRKNRAVQ